MRHIRIHLLAGAAALAMASTQAAIAADMPSRGYPPPPMPPQYFAPIFNWTGFYVGGNLGYGWGKGDGDIGISGLGSGPLQGDGNGFLGGAQAGYNWQAGSLVLGVEADFQGSTAKADITGRAGPASITAESENPWFGTLRGRIGYASDRWLGYVTGGGVYGKTNLSGTVSAPGGGAFDSSETYWSWTVGGGVEYSLWDRWSTKVEYLYVGTPSDSPVPPLTTGVGGDATTHMVRTGLNYRF
jgi:outer membrane immunogenic protein